MKKVGIVIFILVIIGVGIGMMNNKREEIPVLPIKKDITPHTVRFIPVGDSYTIGLGVPEEETWPVRLTKKLQDKGMDIALIANPAQSGWTTQDVLNNQLATWEEYQPTFATLLIGANDNFQGRDPVLFKADFVQIVEHMLKVLPNSDRLVILTLPDHSINAYSFPGTNNEVQESIKAYNAIIQNEANKRGVKVVDTFKISQAVRRDFSLVIKDELHPSGKQYALWADAIYPVALQLLEKK